MKIAVMKTGASLAALALSFGVSAAPQEQAEARTARSLWVEAPLSEPVRRTLKLPLYYTGLMDTTKIREKEGKAKKFTLDREFNVSLTVNISANGYTWFVIE